MPSARPLGEAGWISDDLCGAGDEFRIVFGPPIFF